MNPAPSTSFRDAMSMTLCTMRGAWTNVAVLGEHAAVGRLTLDELEERSSRALAAKTRGELATLTGDLPQEAGQDRPAPTLAKKPVRWMVAIMSGSHRRGRFRAVGSINAISIMGGLVVATALTLVFLPALYAAWFDGRAIAANTPPHSVPARAEPVLCKEKPFRSIVVPLLNSPYVMVPTVMASTTSPASRVVIWGSPHAAAS